jgi:UDP-N-acetylglucosamine acyltransferase
MIHPTAVIHPHAQVDPTAVIGPYAVIDAHVVLGPLCRVGPHVHLTGHTIIGAHNVFHAGCVMGDAPQDLKYNDAPTRLRIGDHNVFREHVTVHRSNTPEEDTVLGSNNFLMAHSHVGHNATLGDGIILANGALLAGHVQVADRAFISGNCCVHQFARIGTLAFMQGTSGVSQDLPPFTIARGDNTICGLNVVGLRRAGYSAADRLELKRLYHALFRSGRNLRAALAEARGRFTSAPARVLMDFVAASKRGVCRDAGSRWAAGEESEEA